MYDQNIIINIHGRLTKQFPRSAVLLGGSYLFGEAGEDSDLDFYVICSWMQLFRYRKRKNDLNQIKQEFPLVRIAFIPWLFFRRGWYQIYGKDLRGMLYQSTVVPKIIFRNSLKLAYFHYINSLVSIEEKLKRKYIAKAAQQIAAALAVVEPGTMPQPLFAVDNLLSSIRRSGFYYRDEVADLLAHRTDTVWWQDKRLVDTGNSVVYLINQTYLKYQAMLCFSFIDYFIYNVSHIKKGNFSFIFRNPDKYILQAIYDCLTSRTCNRQDLSKKLHEIIFPILVV